MKKILIVFIALLLTLSLNLSSVLASPEDLKGQVFPDFTVNTINGTTFTLSESLKTHDLVLINFWATWCGPCCMEFPCLETAWEQYADRVDVIALSIEKTDTFEKLSEFAGEYGLDFLIGRDDTKIFDSMEGTAIPTTLIVDQNRRVVAVEIGAKASPEEFTDLFDNLLDTTQINLSDGESSAQSKVVKSEVSHWDCPECGRKDNKGNYCGGCAHPAPWIESEKTVESSNDPDGTSTAAIKDFKYSKANGQITITGYTGKNKDVVIPAYIENCPVTSIGRSAFGNGAADHIESVLLPETIMRIEDAAFHACYQLRKVNLPDGIVSIGENAFGFCPIEKITLPKSVELMGDGVFWRNSVLKNVVIQNDETIYQGNPFSGCDSLSLDGIVLPKNNSKLYKKNNALFSEKTLLFIPCKMRISSYTIPKGTERIADGAFEGMVRLNELSIPDSVKTIGRNAFLSCESLKTIHFGTGLESIEFCAFIYCDSLEEVNLPEGLVSIGKSAFFYCTKLSKVSIPASVQTIEEGAFDKTNNITIYGNKNSAAEQYARTHNHNFVSN